MALAIGKWHIGSKDTRECHPAVSFRVNLNYFQSFFHDPPALVRWGSSYLLYTYPRSMLVTMML